MAPPPSTSPRPLLVMNPNNSKSAARTHAAQPGNPLTSLDRSSNRRLRAVFSMAFVVTCAVASGGCGGKPDSSVTVTSASGVVVTVPAGDTDAIAESVKTTQSRGADVNQLTHPTEVRCTVMAHIEGRPRGQQFDYRCVVSYPHGESQVCMVAASGQEDGCTPRPLPTVQKH
jgi:hypothetical protein